MPWTGKLAPLYWVHGTAAIIFFLAIASVAAFCSHATVGLINDPAQRKLYMGAYRFLAVLMIGSPIAAYILNAHILRKDNAIYWVEFSGIWAFAAYWETRKRVGVRFVGNPEGILLKLALPRVTTRIVLRGKKP